MGTCTCIIIGVGKHRVMYVIRDMHERRKYLEVYNCVGSTIRGLYVIVFIGFSIWYVTGWEE